MVFNVSILGSNSAIPTIKRNPTAQLINHNEYYYLLDCAEGTQLQLRKYHFKIQRIRHIFISHLHGDHFFGLIGLISSMHLLGRKKELFIYGPPPLKEILNLQLRLSETELCYPLNFVPLNQDISEVIFETDKLIIQTIPLDHKIPTSGFIFKEKQSRRSLKKGVIDKLNIPVNQFSLIKDGHDFTDKDGKFYRNEDITSPPAKARTYAYCSDTRYNESIIPYFEKADLLYHETTFKQDMAEVALAKFHSTSVDAANIALKAKVTKLIIGHFSNRYDYPEELLAESKEVFKNTEIAQEGKTFDV